MCNIKRLATIGIGIVCIACLSACNINVNIQNPESESASEIIAAKPSPSESTTNPEESKDQETKEESYDEAKNLINDYISSGDKALLKQLTESKVKLSAAPNVAGEWTRTDVHSSHSADFDITSVTDEGFKYSAEAYYYSNSGIIEETDAYWVSDNAAISEFTLWEGDEDIKYVLFVWDGEELNIETSASSGEMGLGMNVYMYGKYIQGEPTYTNANILHETFSDEVLEELKSKLSEEDYEDFVFVTENGAPYFDEDGCIIGTIPTMPGYGYHVYINNGKLEGISFEDGREYLF